MRPAIIALTGTVGAGKSTALATLERLGAATVSTDAIVHELLEGDDVRAELVARWGAEVGPEGQVDRGRIATIVFRDPAELEWLEKLLHPRVGRRIEEWVANLDGGVELGVVEVPLLFESGMESQFDAVLCVTAPAEVRRERAVDRGLGEIEGRGLRQLDDEQKAARSDFVVSNEAGVADLEDRLRELMPRLARAGG